jgi:hypothetical protein
MIWLKLETHETRHKIRHRSGHRTRFENGALAGQVRLVGAVDRMREPHPQNRIALLVAGKD